MINLPLTNLSNINRYSGTYLIKSESVSDHVWGMISLALTYIPTINKNREEKNLGSVNIKELIYKIAIHDIDEAFYTDIPRPFKWRDEKIHSEIERVSQELMSENLSNSLIEDINNAKDDSLEGLWVRILDVIQCGYKMIHEINLGNSYMKKELPNVNGVLEDINNSLNDSYEIEKNCINNMIQVFKKYI